MRALEEGMDIHKGVVKNVFSSNVVVVSVLVDMYAKYRIIHNTQKLFDIGAIEEGMDIHS